ncbi:hypothetical protein PFICI_03749 [Pestalotiopsis fici W106-1]|uniref:Heterokaryon incompatibility domain-containing protein n=1 Tax=Pestalotiopsis fici (strain W106-1 / CGMCC3.15140) TaxID=1229662 RepID=W3XIB0_PESFW|nr:uncharacterized protein PFICI_03749 [Pestalotiopsis fici W106-1]ETS85724.1 hypothetical protein PFICI_03749 [Pestalotiopsis fici W106-1]
MALEYEPLEPSLREIRLLTLLPASNTSDDAVSANLQKFSLNRQLIFKALSYVWGDENDTKPIKVNGKTVPITRNLEAALRQLRRSEPLVLWVDALCIDQKNTKEKGFQLPLMCELYTRSQQVIIWLGEGNRYIEALFQWANSTRASEAASIETPPSAIPPAQNESAMAWIGYIDLFLLPYWNRMWTYQEMVLPDNDPVCVYGSHSSPLSVITAPELFSELVRMTDPHSIFTELATLDLSQYEDSIRQKLPFGVDAPVIQEIGAAIKVARLPLIGKKLDKLHILLRSTVGRKSHDPRDRFYALYGLCTQARSLCPADYAESNCIDKVVVMAAVFIAEFELSPYFMIAEFGMRASRFSDLILPSWVPDFNAVPNLHTQEPLCAESLQRRLASDPKPANRCRDSGILVEDPGIGGLEKDISISLPAYLHEFQREVEYILERVSPGEFSSLISNPHNVQQHIKFFKAI